MSDLMRVSLRQVVRQRGFGVMLSIALGITAFIVLAVLGREIRYKVGQDMVLMGRSPHKKMMEGYSEADYRLVEDTLRKTELYPLRQRSYLSLSGGEKQRVSLARAIVQQPELHQLLKAKQ